MRFLHQYGNGDAVQLKKKIFFLDIVQYSAIMAPDADACARKDTLRFCGICISGFSEDGLDRRFCVSACGAARSVPTIVPRSEVVAVDYISEGVKKK